MKIKDFISNVFDRKEKGNKVANHEFRVATAQLFPEESFPTFNDIINRPDEDFYLKSYSSEELHKLPAPEVRRIVLSSDATGAKAHSNFIQYINQGWSFTPDLTEEDISNHPLSPLFENFFNSLGNNTGIDTVIDMMSDSLFKDAAIFSELIFDSDNTTPIDIKTLDANTARFRKTNDPIRGQIYELGQLQSMNAFKSLEEFATVEYVPFIPQAKNPYGKQLITAGVVFAINIHDYWKNVKLANAAITFPSLMLVVDVAKVKVRMGADQTTLAGGPGPEELDREIQKVLKSVSKSIEKIGPGGIMLHSDDVRIEGFLSGQNRANMGMVGEILKELRTEEIDGFQSQPIMHGITNSVSETHASQQIIDYSKLIKNGQKLLQGILTRYANLICIQNGFPPLAQFKFREPLNIEADRESQSIQHRAEANLKQSEALIKYVEFADQMVASGYWDQTKAQEEIDREMLRVFYEEEE